MSSSSGPTGPATGMRLVTIPSREQHEGTYYATVELPWVCLVCGGPRGEPYTATSYDGSRQLTVHAWRNPCGHIEKYSQVRAAYLQANHPPSDPDSTPEPPHA